MRAPLPEKVAEGYLVRLQLLASEVERDREPLRRGVVPGGRLRLREPASSAGTGMSPGNSRWLIRDSQHRRIARLADRGAPDAAADHPGLDHARVLTCSRHELGSIVRGGCGRASEPAT